MIQKWVGARAGVIGNPSDGFGGKTIACLIRNFGARVALGESDTIEIVRHPLFDSLSFTDLADLGRTASLDGYYGGIRLLFATCKKFYECCQQQDISLPQRNFALKYDTNIPRQVGLGGSSAIITAAFKALMEFYQLSDAEIAKSHQPNVVLAVETEELGIAAGLQDRVAQVYGGLVYMDFSQHYMDSQGHGHYEYLNLDDLPPLYLAYESESSHSGGIHSAVRHRFEQGDPELQAAVRIWAQYTDEARAALHNHDWQRLGTLMDRNFDLRRRIYGDEGIGAPTVQMVRTARSLGLSAKSTGSGGAIIGICEESAQFEKARTVFEDLGYHFTRVLPTADEACVDGDPLTGSGGEQAVSGR